MSPPANIFVGYRHGTPLFIAPNIHTQLSKLARKLCTTEDYKDLFINLLKPINDGSGFGYSPESTWFHIGKELFENYEIDNNPVKHQLKNVLVELVSLVSIKHSVKTKWPEIKSFLLQNADTLSLWDEYRAPRDYLSLIKKRKDGSYFQIESGQKVTLDGPTVRTEEEAHYEFIADSCINSFGQLHQLFKLIALLDICYRFNKYPEEFRESVLCVIPDSDYDLSVLHWKWYFPSKNDHIPTLWHPPSCFSDHGWLAADFLATYAEQNYILPDITTGQDTPVTTINEFREAFKRFNRKLIIAVKTDLYLDMGNRNSNSELVYFDFMGRKVIWQNGDRFCYPNIYIPCQKEDMSDGLDICRKFISLLVRESGIPVIEITHIGTAPFHPTTIRQPRSAGGFGMDSRYIQSELKDNLSEKQWTAYALYREGINSDSIFYAFLSLYKIIELAIGNGSSPSHKKWVNANINKSLAPTNDQKWAKSLPRDITAADYLYESVRCAIAHYKNRGGLIINPDKLSDRNRIQRDLPVIRGLANEVFKQNLV